MPTQNMIAIATVHQSPFSILNHGDDADRFTVFCPDDSMVPDTAAERRELTLEILADIALAAASGYSTWRPIGAGAAPKSWHFDITRDALFPEDVSLETAHTTHLEGDISNLDGDILHLYVASDGSVWLDDCAGPVRLEEADESLLEPVDHDFAEAVEKMIANEA